MLAGGRAGAVFAEPVGMKAIKLMLPILSGLALAVTGCKDDKTDRYESPKPVEVDVDKDRDRVKADVDVDKDRMKADVDVDDNDWKVTRDRETAEMKARLSRIDDRIAELRARGDKKSNEAADKLRIERDELSVKLDRAGVETESRWDEFKRDTANAFDKLEDEIDEAF